MAALPVSSVLPGAKTSARSSDRAWSSFATALPRLHRRFCSPRLSMPGRRAGVLFEAATRAKALAPAFAAVGLPVETGGSPKFPQKPLPLRSCSFDPGRSRHRSPLSLCRTRPRGRERPWLLRETFEAQSHGSSARCLRFAPTRCRPARKTRFRLRGLRSAGWGLHPPGLTRKGFSYVSVSHIILLSRACLAQSRFLVPRLPHTRG